MNNPTTQDSIRHTLTQVRAALARQPSMSSVAQAAVSIDQLIAAAQQHHLADRLDIILATDDLSTPLTYAQRQACDSSVFRLMETLRELGVANRPPNLTGGCQWLTGDFLTQLQGVVADAATTGQALVWQLLHPFFSPKPLSEPFALVRQLFADEASG